jgi:hypothetical protein
VLAENLMWGCELDRVWYLNLGNRNARPRLDASANPPTLPHRNRNSESGCVHSGLQGKVRHANAAFFRAKKNSEKELIALCEQQVKEAKLTLEKNLNKREQLKRALKVKTSKSSARRLMTISLLPPAFASWDF